MPDPPDNPRAATTAPVSSEPGELGATGPGADDADDDFQRIPPTRTRRSTLAALSVIAIGGVLLAHLAPDLRYAVSEHVPLELGPARALRFDDGALRDNTLVAVSGLADYRNALLFEPRGDNYRRAFFRLLGTAGRLWVRAEQTSTRHELSDRIVGRLHRFDTLPYADQVRAYYSTLKVTRLLDPTPFQRRGRGEAGDDVLGALVDRGGERVPVPDPATARVSVVVDFPDELLLTLSNDKFAVEEDARREVERLAPLGVAVGPGRAEKAGFVYAVRVAAGRRDAVLTVCEQKDFAVKVRRERYVVPLRSLAVTTGAPGLALPIAADAPPFFEQQGQTLAPLHAESQLVSWERVDSIQIDAPVTIPGDAWIVIEGDLPGDYGWAKALAVVLVLFIAFNGWLLTRSLRMR